MGAFLVYNPGKEHKMAGIDYNDANEQELHICNGCGADAVQIVKEYWMSQGIVRLHLECEACTRKAFPVVSVKEADKLRLAIHRRRENARRIRQRAEEERQLFLSLADVEAKGEAFLAQRHADFEAFYANWKKEHPIDPIER